MKSCSVFRWGVGFYWKFSQVLLLGSPTLTKMVERITASNSCEGESVPKVYKASVDFYPNGSKKQTKAFELIFLSEGDISHSKMRCLSPWDIPNRFCNFYSLSDVDSPGHLLILSAMVGDSHKPQRWSAGTDSWPGKDSCQLHSKNLHSLRTWPIEALASERAFCRKTQKWLRWS